MRAQSIRLPLPMLRSADRLYAKLPTLECRGLCHESCGAVPMTAFEWTRIVARLGGVPQPNLRDADGVPWCPMLTNRRTCGVYDIRPLLCRLWGLIDRPGMRCPHGCVPSFWLSDEEAAALMREISDACGPYTSAQAEILYPDVINDLKNQDKLRSALFPTPPLPAI